MFSQTTPDMILLLMLYAMGATVSAMACVYLLLRKGNAFTRHIQTPRRLRLWTAAFFGIVALGHVWYMPAGIVADGDAVSLWMLIGGLLDCLLTIPLAIAVLLCMPQDRRRPLWPAWAVTAPLSIGMLVSIALRSYALMPWMRGYFALMVLGLIVYMVREVRRYGRWLRDNFADLEHKEVWQSFLVLAMEVLMFGIYASGNWGMVYECVVQVCGIALVGFLLWRVETLSDLSVAQPVAMESPEGGADHQPTADADASEGLSDTTFEQIGALLKQCCEDTQLFLRHDLTLSQLAQEVGTNRTYLSLYFSRLDTTYNAYINDLRIRYFTHLYSEAVAAGRDNVTAQELARQSGYRSYRTFSLAFKQRMGRSVTDWQKLQFAVSK